MRWPLFTAWVLAALALGALAGGLALRALDPDPSGSGLEVALYVALTLPIAGAGVVIARRRPRNPVGAIVAALGLVAMLEALGSSWAGAGLRGGVAGGAWGALIAQEIWIPAFGLLALLLLLFPDGRTPGPRWRPAVALTVASTAVLGFAALTRDQPLDAPYTSLGHPLATIPDAVAGPLAAACVAALAVSLALAACGMVVRFRRATGAERTQMKWLAAAAALLPAAIVACILEGLVTGEPGPVTAVAFVAMYLALAGAVAVAMLRHGLYDIDRLISRTIAWVALTLVLALAAVGVALLVADPLGGGSTVGAAVAAVAAALAFDPLRRRIQRVVDRRFDRDRTRAVELVEGFARALQDGTAAPEDVEGLLREVLGDPGLRVLVWLPASSAYAGLDGVTASPPPPGGGASVTAMGHGDAPLAMVVHDPAVAARPALLADVLRAAALPVEVARLRAELRGRLEEVEESRARIVRAGDEERRRLQRDLHDGAQQRLLAIGMGLRRLQRRLGGDPDSERAIDEAVDGVAEAVRDLREIARGLRPGMLDDGLGPALADLARRTPLDVDVEAPGERVAPEVETAAYYVVSEALANAVKHARASRVLVSARRDDGHLVVRVEDDGRGGAVPEPAGGLAGLADRIAAHGGRMDLVSPPGRGTRLEVVLPCGS